MGAALALAAALGALTVAGPDGGVPVAAPAAGDTHDDLLGVPQEGPAAVATPADPVRSDLPPDNPLTIGGLLYLRSQLSGAEGQPSSQWPLSAPFLLDTYLDARPNDRVRGFVLLRTTFDPTYTPNAPSQFGLALTPQPNPDFLIDQLWIKFDVEHQVFVTAGRQHVKWGAAHFWFPNDLLNPVKLQPLAVFDQRTGVTMLKATLPLETLHLNLSAIALLEGLQQANQLGKVGGAFRAEYVLGTAEAGMDVQMASNQHARYGGDLSFGWGDFDLYAEGSLTDGRDAPVWQELAAPDPSTNFLGSYLLTVPSGYQPQVAAGLNYGWRYGNNRVLTFGGEYFYDALGTGTPSIYPWLLLHNAFNFFYVGQHYAGVYVLADKPGELYNSTINFSTLGNLSDHSFLSRLDFFQTVLTHLRFEAFIDLHYGGDGEFHLAFDTAGGNVGTFTVPAIHLAAPIFDTGVALRLSL